VGKDRLVIPIKRVQQVIYLIQCLCFYARRGGHAFRERFPEDFIFPLTKEEFAILKSQNVISSWRGLRRATPYTFTEQGVAMLSSILHSKCAIRVNIEIMRAFVKLRKMLASHAELARQLKELEKKYDSQFKVVFEAIWQLMVAPERPSKKIGFLLREKRPAYGRL